MARRLLTATSIFCAMLTIAFAGLFVRSYWGSDSLRGRLPEGSMFVLLSSQGRVVWYTNCLKRPGTNAWEFDSNAFNGERQFWQRSKACGLYAIGDGDPWKLFAFPHGFLVLISGGLFAAIQICRSRRFTLRALFAACTFLAVVMSLIVAS